MQISIQINPFNALFLIIITIYNIMGGIIPLTKNKGESFIVYLALKCTVYIVKYIRLKGMRVFSYYYKKLVVLIILYSNTKNPIEDII